MTGSGEDHADARRSPAIERGDRMRREPGQQRPRPIAVEPPADEPGRRKRPAAEAQSRHRMERRPERAVEGPGPRRRPVVHEGADEPAIRRAVTAEAECGLLDGPVEDHGRAVVEGVGERDGGMDPLEPVVPEAELGERGRGRAERMDGRAHVVTNPRKGQLFRPGATPDAVCGFDHVDGVPACGKRSGGGEAVGSGSDNDGIEHSASVRETSLRARETGVGYGPGRTGRHR